MSDSSVFAHAGDLLTARETELAEIIEWTGASNEQISQELGISVGTVKVHLHMIYKKLGIDDRSKIHIALAKRRLIHESYSVGVVVVHRIQR